ncbi:MAG: flavodoxin family protein [Planctomycetes bacterium]|nr:flavodoxin family protein [Planctomycetota bacterium]
MATVAIVYHSGYGHTKAQAEAVQRGAASVAGTTASLLTSDEASKDLSALDPADCIIFGCPTYMGGPSAQFKQFIDAAGNIWLSQGWKDKLAAGFTNSGGPSGDKLATLSQLWMNAMQHSMLWVSQGFLPGADGTGGTDRELNRLSSYGGAMAQSPHGSTAPLPADLASAERFGRRVAEVTVRWVKGKGA